MNKPTDQQVVGGFNRKEKWALAHIYKEYRATVYELARRLLNNEDAEDVTSEVFEKLLGDTERRENIKAISDFLNQTTIWKALNKKKRQDNERTIIADIAYRSSPFSEDEIASSETAAVLWQYVYKNENKLTPQCRRVFELYYRDEKSIQEIAQELNISLKTAFNSKSKAMSIMRLEIKPRRPFIFILTLFI